jgi:hypothetical protein
MEFVQMTDFIFYKKVEYLLDIRPLKPKKVLRQT